MTNEELEIESKDEFCRLIAVFGGFSLLVILVVVYQTLCFLYVEGTVPGIIDFLMTRSVKSFPTNIIIGTLTLCTLIYGGVESSVSVIKSLDVPKGSFKPLPPKHRKRMWFLFIDWLLLFSTVTVCYFIAGDTSGIDFVLSEIAYGLASSVTILFASNRLPKVAKDLGKSEVTDETV